MPIYVAADLRHLACCLPEPWPSVVWTRFKGQPEQCPAWLLTPGTYARFRLAWLLLDAKWAKGEASLANLEVATARWQAIEEAAMQHLDQADIDAACSALARGGRPAALPAAPPRPWLPFDEGRHEYDAEAGRWRWVEAA